MTKRSKKRMIYSIVLMIISGIFICHLSYARYHQTADISAGTITGDIICDVTLDTSETYIENNVAYFRIKVSNKKDNILTSTNVDYKLTITNVDNSNGIYYLIDDDGNTSSENESYSSSIITKTYSFDTTEQMKEFKVYVKSDDGKEANIKFNVNIEAVQKQMD